MRCSKSLGAVRMAKSFSYLSNDRRFYYCKCSFAQEIFQMLKYLQRISLKICAVDRVFFRDGVKESIDGDFP